MDLAVVDLFGYEHQLIVNFLTAQYTKFSTFGFSKKNQGMLWLFLYGLVQY